MEVCERRRSHIHQHVILIVKLVANLLHSIASRTIKDLVTCYKYINGFTDVDSHYFSIQLQPEVTDSVLPNCFMFSFFNRVVLAWNCLSNFGISAQNPVLFRKYQCLCITV